MAETKTTDETLRSQRAFFIKRTILGLVGLSCLLLWVGFYLTQGFDNIPAGVDVLCRIGLMLVVVWFAIPTVAPLFRYGSSLLIGSGLVILVISAARPNIAKIVAAVAIAAIVINWVLRKLAGTSPKR